MSKSNSIFKTGWAAAVLVGTVLLLFCAWLFLKVYRNDADRRRTKEQLQVNTETKRNAADEVAEAKNQTGTGTSEPHQAEEEDGKTEGAEEKADQSGETNKDGLIESQKTEDKKTDDAKNKTDESTDPGAEEQKQEASTHEDTSEVNTARAQGGDAVDPGEQRTEQADSESSGEDGSSEEEMVQIDQAKLEKAKELYAKKAYQKAIQRLDDILSELEEGERMEELRQLKSNWTEEYSQRQKLAEKWITRAQTAAGENDWSSVIEFTNHALEHLPGNSRATNLKERATEMRAYQGMVKIPGDTYSYLNEDRNGDKEVAPFYIDRYEVTNSDYKKFMAETGHAAPLGWDDRSIPVGREDHPVSGISYDDARAYASWAGKKLPTERQWEVAARGTNGRSYPWGPLENGGGSAPANTVEMGVGGTLSVDELSEGCTPEDICHLVGNVAEWTRTTRKSRSGQVLQVVVKGGSFLYSIETGKPSNRLLRAPDVRLKAIGFRCVKSPK